MDKKPVYVKVDKYNEVLEVVGLIQKKIEQTRKILGKIEEIKHQEDSELGTWRTDLDEIESKMGSISEMLSETDD